MSAQPGATTEAVPNDPADMTVTSPLRLALLDWLHSRCGLRDQQVRRLFWDDNPGDEVGDDGEGDREDDGEDPEDPHDRDIDIEVAREGGADAADLPVGSRTLKPLESRSANDDTSTVGTKSCVVLNALAAIVAEHMAPLP